MCMILRFYYAFLIQVMLWFHKDRKSGLYVCTCSAAKFDIKNLLMIISEILKPHKDINWDWPVRLLSLGLSGLWPESSPPSFPSAISNSSLACCLEKHITTTLNIWTWSYFCPPFHTYFKGGMGRALLLRLLHDFAVQGIVKGHGSQCFHLSPLVSSAS